MMNNHPRAVDAIPSHIMRPFLAHAKQRGEFFGMTCFTSVRHSGYVTVSVGN